MTATDIRLKQAGLNQYHDVFELDRKCLLHHDATSVTIAVPYEEIEQAGWVTSERALDDERDARQEGREEVVEELQYGIDSSMQALLVAAEQGRLLDRPSVSQSDIRNYGETVAALRAALDIVVSTLQPFVTH